MPHSWFAVQASAPNAADIAIRGLIGEWGVTDRDLIAEVEALGDVQNISLRINSRGGEVDHALSIFNYLTEHPATVTVRVDGVAMSAASIIMLAADRVVMPENAIVMVHNPWSYAAGDAAALRNEADALEKFQKALVATYVARTGRSAEEVQTLLDEETYLTAQEAKDLGFCDEVEPVPTARSASAFVRVMACAMGIPDDVLARVQAAEAEGDPAQSDDSRGGDPASGEPAPSSGSSNPPPATLATQIQALAGDFGLKEHVSVFALATDIASVDAARSAMATACEVRDLCNAVGMGNEAGRLITKRASMAEARTDLQNLLAERGDAQPVNHHQPSPQAKPAQTAQAVWSKVIPTLAS